MRVLTLPVVAALAGAVVLAAMWHISVGARSVPLSEVWRALTAPDPALFDHAVVRDLRLPRALSAAAVGAALAVAGALMQAVTRNPLAEPATLGLMAGASSAVVLGIGWLGIAGTGWIPAFAAGGAVAAAALVWALAAAVPGGARPLSMILAGAAVAAFLGALDSIAILLDEETFRALRGWLAGSLAGADIGRLTHAAPWLGLGMILALGLARPMTALALGDETAQGLGLPVARLRALAVLAVVMLTAAAVSVAGLMGFVGLVIPHVVRLFAGADYARIVPMSALLGAAYLVVIDTVARIALAPLEISTGLMTAVLGAPVFLWLVRARA
jgi:iron complex transport system permease protein